MTHTTLMLMTTTRKPKSRPRGRPKTNTVRVMLKLRPETDDLLYKEAGKAGVTKSEFVERAIRTQIASVQ